MQRRVKASRETLEAVQTDIKDKGFALDEISGKIGSDFRNFRYKRMFYGKLSLKFVRKVQPLKASNIDF